MLQVQLAGKHLQTMADSGSVYTCVGPMSRQFLKSIGFSGKKVADTHLRTSPVGCTKETNKPSSVGLQLNGNLSEIFQKEAQKWEKFILVNLPEVVPPPDPLQYFTTPSVNKTRE